MSKQFEDALPGVLLQKAAPKLLVAIVNRADSPRVAKLLYKHHLHFIISCMGEGTAGKGLIDLMGFSPSDKAVILCIAPGIKLGLALEELNRHLHLEKPGRGIAFTIPLSWLSLPAKRVVDEDIKKHIQKRIERGADSMLGSIEHDVIVAIVNQGYSEALMEQARGAGVMGGTVVHGSYLGLEHAVKFLGAPLQEEREIVSILASREIKEKVMDQVAAFFQANPKAAGVVFALPVDTVVGLGG